ncbi:MAG: TolC family protein [Verrucomicrobia bacterium]|nr:TolC family protein [Verrucomicrobiota bacterium]
MKTPAATLPFLRTETGFGCFRTLVVVLLWGWAAGASSDPAPAGSTGLPPWLRHPLSLADCLNIAFEQNSEVLKSRKDIEAATGLAIQTRAIIIPKVRASGDYSIRQDSNVDTLEVPAIPGITGGLPVINPGDQNWSAGIHLVQSLYEGGRMSASWKTARLLKEQALARHHTVLADVATEVRVAYYNVLLAEKEIEVSEASVELLTRELEDSTRRFNAGTVPRFNVLRAEVELANARPRVSRARNGYRIAKNVLVNALGYRVPADIWEDIPLQLTDTLELPRFDLAVPQALALALERRPELVALRKNEELRKQGVVTARAGYLPRIEGFVGYSARKSMFSADLGDDVHGWEAGVQATWNLFDGAFTRGKVAEARALQERAELETDDTTRRIELEVRTAYSTLIESWEVLESQQKVVEQAEEALRLARARSDAGTGTQLDVLSAQTALTDARTTEIRARREYAVARTRLERAIGAYVPEVQERTAGSVK